MENGVTWTCQDLQNAVQDVNPFAHADEARHCLDYQVIAELHGCVCNGPEVESLLNGKFKDLNPSCKLCSQGDFDFVPTFLIEDFVRLPDFGAVNCGGMFEAALDGNVLTVEMCDKITADFSAGCCSLPNNDIVLNKDAPPATPSPVAPQSTPAPTRAPTAGPTNPPTRSPTPSPSPDLTTLCGDQVEFVLELQTDKYPDDISWTLSKTAFDGNVGAGSSYTAKETQHLYSACLEPGEEYIFTIYDVYGDGICCEWGTGWYEVKVEGQ
ncbi:MAG: hypothetical protein SGILL_000266, partial [Bacillariaceae sp.]